MVEIDTTELTATIRCTLCRSSVFYLIIIQNKKYLVCQGCGGVSELEKIKS